MSKRVLQIADELGFRNSKELIERVKELDLSFSARVNSAMLLDDKQIAELTDALSRSTRQPEKKVVKAGVIRRRVRPSRAQDEAPAAGDEAPTAEAPAAAAAPVSAEPVEAEEVEESAVGPRRRFATVSTREAEEEAAPVEVAAAAPVEVEAPAEAVAPTAPAVRRRMDTVVTRPEPVVEAAADEVPADATDPTLEPVVAAPRARFATVETRQVGAPAITDELSPMEQAEIARREADAQAEADATRRSGARVVGTLNPDLLTTRLEADRKDFTPGRKREPVKKEKKKGKRVVQSRDLYDGAGRGRKKGRMQKGGGQQTKITQAAEHKRVVRMEETITVGDLAQQMSVKGGEIVMKLVFELGMKGATINTIIDADTAQLLAEIYEYKVDQVGFDLAKYLPEVEESDEDRRPRPPVVTVMGHVDHGKTSLLDAIRESAVTEGEAGGITQHIGAYRVERDGRAVCFLDTPGHEAFTALRARGAKATDIVILVVAADDGVMPQTVEAINHARDAEVPIIVAINKIDKPGANPERIRQALTEYELVPEEWGGDTLFAEVSAKMGQGIDELIETLFLQAEVLELSANPNRVAQGIVIESKLDTGRGPVATVLVQKGTLHSGDIIVMGQYYGRVRTMSDEFNRTIVNAVPSTPVEITGLNGVPESGEFFYVVKDEKDARTIAEHVGLQNKQSEMAQSIGGGGGMERIAEMLKAGDLKELKLIVKGDVQGSVEAVAQALGKLSTDKVGVRIIHAAVGSITESDVNLAASSDSSTGSGVVIVGFNVKAETRAQNLADQNNVNILTQSIIYDIIDKVRALMEGLLEPVYIEEFLGRAEVRALFRVPRMGTIAGCMITDGVMQRGARARVLRDGEIVSETNISSLRHFNEDRKEMRAGFECGISLEHFNDLVEGDIIENVKLKETKAVL